MTASEVAMNSALPSPQPARKPTIWPMLPTGPGDRGERDDQHQAGDQRALGADPAGHPAGDQHRHRGDHQVAGEQQLDLGRARVQLGRSAGRIGSTRPMPMKEMTQANATAQTALGWRNGLADCAVGSMVCRSVMYCSYSCDWYRRRRHLMRLATSRNYIETLYRTQHAPACKQCRVPRFQCIETPYS